MYLLSKCLLCNQLCADSCGGVFENGAVIKYTSESKLAKWCGHQRVRWTKKSLPKDQHGMLRDASLVDFWQANGPHLKSHSSQEEEAFSQKVAKLRELNAKAGSNHQVHYHRQRNSPLDKWAHTLRQHRKAGKLSADRIKQLNDIGFVWVQRDVHASDGCWFVDRVV